MDFEAEDIAAGKLVDSGKDVRFASSASARRRWICGEYSESAMPEALESHWFSREWERAESEKRGEVARRNVVVRKVWT